MDAVIMTVKGKGGHGGEPHNVIDPVVIASHIIVALQQVVSRMSHPGEPTVLSFGKVIANGAVNVIPDEVTREFSGTGSLLIAQALYGNVRHKASTGFEGILIYVKAGVVKGSRNMLCRIADTTEIKA